ncbi:MAG: hypothetical protein RLZZ367_877 [Bacteroidota bacterium]
MSIKVSELTKVYGAQRAVDAISFEVSKGEVLGFLGPNGAGKSTTMKMLTCFIPQTAGTATVCGFDTAKAPLEVAKKIGYLPETTRCITICMCASTWSLLPGCISWVTLPASVLMR